MMSSDSSVKPKPSVDVKDFLSAVASKRQPSPTRTLIPLMKIPGMLSLGTGVPNPACFPFTAMSFTLTSGETVALTPEELSESLQYSATPGVPALLEQLRELQLRDHTPGYDASELSISVSTGSQDALAKAFGMLINPGDTVLVENPTYSGALAILRPLGANLVGVDVDSEGLVPSSLAAALAKLPTSGAQKPRVLYTIVTGQNPAGVSTTAARKAEVYALAQQHNLCILEDDPYWNLAFGRDKAPPAGQEASYAPPVSTSYLSLDTDGRVLRFDSFSKVLSSGMRLGFVTGPKPWVEQLNLSTQALSIHPSGVPQVLAARLLKTWGAAGWAKHVRATKLFYHRRRDVLLEIMERHFAGLNVSYDTPDAGMFVWIKVRGLGSDAKTLIEDKAVKEKVLLLPGEAFLVDPAAQAAAKPDELYVRACFSIATDEEMDEAIRRFAGLLRKETEAKNAAK
jgi:kynurenine/2-aminoadipate aminotransferase